jgi:flagellar basal body-associated protein FliL
MRAGWRFHFGWERAAVGDEPKRRIKWTPIIVVLAILAGGLSIASYLLTPSAPAAPAPVAHIQPAPTVTVTATPQPVTSVQLNSHMGAVCILPTSKALKRTVVVKVP